ncbi:MAG: NAD(P)/FAD-dependent oxidoreductase [Bacteroidota bacterium]
MQKLIHTRTRIEDLGKPRIVVIGGGFGGLELVKALKGVNAQVVLFDKYNHHTFQPLLYQVATSGLETSSIIFPFRKKFAGHKDFYFRMGEVTQILPEQNCIETSIGTVKYDYLVIATGASTNYFGNQNIMQKSYPLKTIEDAIDLRNQIIKNFELALLTDDKVLMNSLIDFVIVGGGPTGVELAGSLAELKKHVFPADYQELDLLEMDIHLVEGTGRLLNGMSEEAGEEALKFLQDLGVQVHLNTFVKDYHDDQVDLGDKKIPTKNLIWAAGVLGNPTDGLNTDVRTRNNRLKVDEYNRVEGYENIFAIGDVAAMITDDLPAGHPMVAPPAMQQGVLLASNLQSMMQNKPLKKFSYQDQGSMATIGRNKAVVDLLVGKKPLKTQGTFAWLIWMFVHLMSLVGFRNRILVFISWVWSYFSYDKSNRLIIGKTETLEAEEVA